MLVAFVSGRLLSMLCFLHLTAWSSSECKVMLFICVSVTPLLSVLCSCEELHWWSLNLNLLFQKKEVIKSSCKAGAVGRKKDIIPATSRALLWTFGQKVFPVTSESRGSLLYCFMGILGYHFIKLACPLAKHGFTKCLVGTAGSVSRQHLSMFSWALKN